MTVMYGGGQNPTFMSHQRMRVTLSEEDGVFYDQELFYSDKVIELHYCKSLKEMKITLGNFSLGLTNY